MGIQTESDIDRVVELLRCKRNPLIERTSVFMFYRAWARKDDLARTALELSAEAANYLAGESSQHKEVLRHFKADIVAQLLRETRQKQRYVGFDTFVKMSAGLPRGLLTMLKHVYTWSTFYGEKPFHHGARSVNAQADGILQAAEWFFTEARAPGAEGKQIRDAMTRLGQLFRDIRFSDKPSESSLSTFSANVTTASDTAVRVLKDASNWSMLIRVPGGQHDRNDGRVDEKYQVHPMLAPRWDLPIARRGALGLASDEVTAIFAPETPAQFDEVLRRRVSAMTAPHFGGTGKGLEDGLFSEPPLNE